jgi:hypothetical protein
LYGEIELIAARKEQFMRAGLLDSQLATLEERAPVGWDGARHKRHQDASRQCGEPIPYALETDWPVETAGFEHLHSRIGIAKTLSSRRQDSNLCILKSDLIWPS